MTANRLLFAAVLAVLVLLIVGMLALSGGSAEGSEGLAVLARTLIGVGLVVLIVEAIRRLVQRSRRP